MEDIIKLYCSVEDFWERFEPIWNKHLLESCCKKRGPKSKLSIPEMMTILIMFHQSNYRTFKHFYSFLQKNMLGEFPDLISYSRFVYLMKGLVIPFFVYLTCKRGEVTGISFIDSTAISVCKNKRISRNSVFKGVAKRGKNTTGWFYGFKLHLIINDQGEILSFLITPGNRSDLSALPYLTRGIIGKLFGDKGYISSSIGQSLLKQGLELITTLRANMKQKLISLTDKILLRKRSLIETVNDQLKNISQIEHSRHRSIPNFFINILSGIAAYIHQPKKPSLNIQWPLKIIY